MEILTYPNEALRNKAEAIDMEDSEFMKYIHCVATDMQLTMLGSNGIGLASTQVGIPYRIFAFDSNIFEKVIVLANPKITFSDGEVVEEEACLSIPGYSARVKRSLLVQVEWDDISTGNHRDDWFSGRDARVIQHELDHLDGILYIDHLGPLKRRMFEKRYAKLQKQGRIPKY